MLHAFDGLVDACRALDAERYFAFFDKERFSGLSAEGKAWHSIGVLEEVIHGGFAAVDEILALEFNNVKVTVINPSTAILVNEYRQTVRLKDGSVVHLAGGGSQVWVACGSAWKLVSVCASDARQREELF